MGETKVSKRVAAIALDVAFSEFINGYGDPYEPKEDHDKETARNIDLLYDAWSVARERGLFPEADGAERIAAWHQVLGAKAAA